MLLLTVAVAFAAVKARQAGEEEERARLATVARLIHQGVGYWLDHKWPAAEQKFEEALELDPDNISGLYSYACTKKDQYNEQHVDGLLAEADGLLERALAVDRQRVEIWNAKGTILRMQGRVQDAIDTHRKGATVDNSYYANWVSLANAYAVGGDVPEAERCLHAAIERPRGAGDFMPWHNLAAVQLQLSRPEALTSLEKALELGKDKAVTRAAKLLEAKIRLHLAGCVDAEKALAAAITADGLGGPDQGDARIKRILALAHLRSQHWSDAVDNAAQALKLDNQAPHANLIMAIAESRLGHGDAAHRHLDTAAANWPAALQATGVTATADRGLLWFETITDLQQLRTEAEAALAADPP
jgi:Tfp pilus assembly protein PilF